ncbi:aminotransferase class IV [Paenibacillus sp. P96]|uniref:Aminotransferase class IV n=1 Tax=Paenibacillus zeirhizosphaerae TaxID=2987519 RepID=A0ABT9FWV5_9BACL|nr:aminotransferase class IV [Paenibacillus sp. P96]MDP4099205.1 aminotransferase class IV [Paenibacillus sp. P96]
MKYIGMNGVLTDAAAAVVHVSDHGFLYGMGLFETFRTYNGLPFLLDRHLRRMSEGCRMLGIPFQMNEEEWTELISRLMEANGLKEAYIRYTVSAGEEAFGLPVGGYSRPNHVLFARALPTLSPDPAKRSKALYLLHTRRSTPESGVRLKSLHYMNNIVAKRELAGYEEASPLPAEGLMLTSDGYICEGIVSNVFFVKDGVLHTPDLSTGALGGITREFVMELSRGLGIRALEGMYTWNDLKQADEVFLTGSVQEITPVTRLIEPDRQSRRVGSGSHGPVTERLLRLYHQKAGVKE